MLNMFALAHLNFTTVFVISSLICDENVPHSVPLLEFSH